MKRTISILLLALLVMPTGLALEVSGSAPILNMLNQDPDPVMAGDIVELRIGVQNIGSTTGEEYIVEIVPSYPFEAVPGESLTKNLGVLSSANIASNMIVAKFKLMIDNDAKAGSYDVEVKSYEAGSSQPEVAQLFRVDVESRESAEVIYIDQVELIPGHITPMKFTVNNVGSAPLRELTFQWENEDNIILPVGSDNTRYVKFLEVGESVELVFDVIASANADPDLYKLDLKLSYDDPLTGDIREVNTKAGVYVGGSTDFDVAYSGVSDGEYSFSIANIGSVSATSVTVKFPAQPRWSVSGSSSVIIGNLNKGDYTIASFRLQQANMMNGTRTSTQPARDTGSVPSTRNMSAQREGQPQGSSNSINLEIFYTDSRGNRNVINKQVQVDPSTTLATSLASGSIGAARYRQQQSPFLALWNIGKWFVAAGIVLVVITAVRRRYKKGKLDDPDYTIGKMIRGNDGQENKRAKR